MQVIGSGIRGFISMARWELISCKQNTVIRSRDDKLPTWRAQECSSTTHIQKCTSSRDTNTVMPCTRSCLKGLEALSQTLCIIMQKPCSKRTNLNLSKFKDRLMCWSEEESTFLVRQQNTQVSKPTGEKEPSLFQGRVNMINGHELTRSAGCKVEYF